MMHESRELPVSGPTGEVPPSGASVWRNIERPDEDEVLLASHLWEGGDLPITELGSLWRSSTGYRLRGSVVGSFEDRAVSVRYRIDCDAGWHTRAVRVELSDPPAFRVFRADVGPDGRWWVDGVERPEFDGLADVDLQVTPSTNTLPIRRLGLEIGQEEHTTAVWIRFPALGVSPLEQSYRRVDERHYEYRSGDFRAELDVRPDGVVERYGTFWRIRGIATLGESP